MNFKKIKPLNKQNLSVLAFADNREESAFMKCIQSESKVILFIVKHHCQSQIEVWQRLLETHQKSSFSPRAPEWAGRCTCLIDSCAGSSIEEPSK